MHRIRNNTRNHNTINSICWNKTGTHFITGGRDSVLRLYSCDNDMKKSTDFKGHTNSVNFVAFDNPESENMFASVSEDQSFRVWDTRKKTPVHVERTKEKLLRGMFCPVVEGDKGNIFATCNYEDEAVRYIRHLQLLGRGRAAHASLANARTTKCYSLITCNY